MKFYLRLALRNIKKNKKLYSSYFISTIFSIALYFIIKTVGNSPTLKGQDSITMFLNLGGYVIALFSLIFLFYTNSFVIKNRKKEISLYHILGMEKRNVRSMMLLETIVIALISLVSGIVIGMLLSQITSVIILRIIHKSIHFSLIFSIDAFIKTIIIFSIIFFLSLIYNISVVVRSNPIELLKGQNIGEKEPKTKIFLTLLGIIALSSGYYIALSITDPMQAMVLFFVAVILVMIGTYCLFTAGSIALLKFLKSRRNFYYQPTHFTSISGLLYRMKQNAVGLANICILCTCVLVTLSSTICLYNGIQDSIKRQFYMDGTITVTDSDYPDHVYEDVKGLLKNKKYDSLYTLSYYNYTGSLKKNKVHLNDYDYNHLASINLISLEDYNHYFNQNLSLNNNEAYLYSYEGYNNPTISLENIPYTIKGQIKNRQLQANNCFAPNNISIVINQSALNNYKLKSKSYFIGFNASKKVVDEVTTAIIHKDYNYLGNKYYLS
ncbi:FtsX-like permease family protein, partial [Faecalibacillus faecis]|uniref:FtsX-like permease family protein n=1 Tax=Faecalibacillus faecis TaxID=1982628 RepID=UPI003AB436BC